MEEILNLQKELHVLMEQEILKWKQRAKKHWYKNGDRNTRFFHACANQRRHKNHIRQIYDKHLQLHVSDESIEGAFRSFYVKLLSLASPSRSDIVHCVSGIQKRVNYEMNAKLL